MWSSSTVYLGSTEFIPQYPQLFDSNLNAFLKHFSMVSCIWTPTGNHSNLLSEIFPNAFC